MTARGTTQRFNIFRADRTAQSVFFLAYERTIAITDLGMPNPHVDKVSDGIGGIIGSELEVVTITTITERYINNLYVIHDPNSFCELAIKLWKRTQVRPGFR
ncbi:hypothetical protein EMIT0162MI3_60087 [Pseudomonas chlororaphis]